MAIIKLTILYKCYIPHLVNSGSVVFEKKMLTYNEQRTTGCQHIASGHLSDSGDLKRHIFLNRVHLDYS